MRTIFVVLACVGIFLGVLFVVLPMGSIAIIPSVIGALFAYLALKKSEEGSKKIPKVLTIISFLLIIVGVSKHFFVKTEIAQDNSFQERVDDSQKEAIEELEDIEKELEGLEE